MPFLFDYSSTRGVVVATQVVPGVSFDGGPLPMLGGAGVRGAECVAAALTKILTFP